MKKKLSYLLWIFFITLLSPKQVFSTTRDNRKSHGGWNTRNKFQNLHCNAGNYFDTQNSRNWGNYWDNRWIRIGAWNDWGTGSWDPDFYITPAEEIESSDAIIEYVD